MLSFLEAQFESHLNLIIIGLVAIDSFLALLVILMMTIRLLSREASASTTSVKETSLKEKRSEKKVEPAIVPAPVVASPLSPPLPEVPVTPPPPPPRVVEAEAEMPAGEDTKGLHEKIKFLENKLLEYEILQEEISLLSTLKAENEQLRAQIITATSGKGAAKEEKVEPQPVSLQPKDSPPAAKVQS